MPEVRFRFRRDKVAWRVIGDEALVLDLRTNVIYFLNQTAAALWQRLEACSNSFHLSARS